jgi:ligand-binding SRPBCC domain-containing protein
VNARFACETFLPAPPATVFGLALNVDLHVGSMAASGESAVGGRTTGVLGPGEEVIWRARHFGLTWSMTARITDYEPPRRFVDQQTRGPFRFFRHEHLFEEVPGGTKMTDRIEFAAPLGPAGRAAELLLRRHLRRLIESRGAYLATQAS